MVGDGEYKDSLEELQMAFNREIQTDKRMAAETAYALAFRYRNEDVEGKRLFDVARTWAIRSVELLDALPSETLEQVASTRTTVGGISLPEFLYSNVVRQRLADLFF